jgi:hypothetical protein
MATLRRRFLQSSAGLAAGLLTRRKDASALPANTEGANGSLPTVSFGKYQVSRLIIGANPFYGYSHFNKLFSQHMSEWSTPENICKTLHQCERNGINTWQFSHSGRGLSDIDRYRAEGGRIQWILLSSRAMETNLDLIPQIAKKNPIGIVHHGGTTDRRWLEGEQGKIKEFLKRVRDSGVMVGISTHNPQVVEAVNEQNWDVDFLMTAVYCLTRSQDETRRLLGQVPLGETFLPNDPPRMFQAIRHSKKQCLAYKILAAGRVTDDPKDIDKAFQTTLESIKPQDCVIVGMYPKFSDQVRENAERVRRYTARQS